MVDAEQIDDRLARIETMLARLLAGPEGAGAGRSVKRLADMTPSERKANSKDILASTRVSRRLFKSR